MIRFFWHMLLQKVVCETYENNKKLSDRPRTLIRCAVAEGPSWSARTKGGNRVYEVYGSLSYAVIMQIYRLNGVSHRIM